MLVLHQPPELAGNLGNDPILGDSGQPGMRMVLSTGTARLESVCATIRATMTIEDGAQVQNEAKNRSGGTNQYDRRDDQS